MSRLIVVVTGANSGIGFATCQRLLCQLSLRNPPDAEPQFDDELDAKADPGLLIPGQALTLIMACRNVNKAKNARDSLFMFLDALLARRESQSGYDDYGATFRKSLKIEIECCDLAVVGSVIKCAGSLRGKYPYISHLICNAGCASFYGIDWLVALPTMLVSPILGTTLPQFNLQRSGERSVDGLGWVWQCNVFGHYFLYREVLDLLSAYSRPSNGNRPARVLWTSSLEAVHYYDSEDWQLLRTDHSYESSKYQIDLIGTQLDKQAMEEQRQTDSPCKIRHFVVQPGIAHTGMASLLIVEIMQYLMLLAFYFARLLGSPHHPIDPFKAAISSVHVSLAPLEYLPSQGSPTNIIYTDVDSPSLMECVSAVSKVQWAPFTKEDAGALLPPVRFGSQCDRMGRESVGLTRVKQWKDHEEESKVLLTRFEELHQSLLIEESQGPDIETFRGMNGS